MKSLFTNPTYHPVRQNVTFKLIIITLASIIFGITAAFAGNGKCTPVVEKCVVGNATATNIKYFVNGKSVSGLRGNVPAGSKVKVTFTTASKTTETRFSLVSYKAPSASFDEKTANQQVVYDFVTRMVKPGTHTFEVDVPNCYFQVDFVKGCIIEKLGPAGSDNFYSPQGRLIDADNGGSSRCDCNSLIDVSFPEEFAVGYPDTTVTHTVKFKNLSTKISDRVNIFVQSEHSWKVEMRNTNGDKLYATDNNGDGTWEYVNASYDLDKDGNPETVQLNKNGGSQSFIFIVSIPEDAEIGMLDSLYVFGSSYTDHCDKDMAYGLTEVDEPFVLPIELLYFSAKVNVDHVKLEWATASELNNDFFTIERSENGTTFYGIDDVKGAGTNNSVLEYEARDSMPEVPVMYYRLRQTDYDGTFTYSNIVMVKGVSGRAIVLEGDAFPNPFSREFSVNFNAEAQGTVIATIIDIQGKVITMKSMHAAKGHNQFVFDQGNSLPKGMYFLTLEHNGTVISSKLSKTADF
jgi:hypothetical protein